MACSFLAEVGVSLPPRARIAKSEVFVNSWERLSLAPHKALVARPGHEAREELRLWSAAPRLGGCTRGEWRSTLERDDAVLRESLPVHISTSAVVFCREPDTGTCEALLLWHLKALEWVYPGGHADGDWNFLRSALREVQEETSLQDVFWLHTRAGVPPGVPAAVQRIGVGEHAHFDAVFYLECRPESKLKVITDAHESGAFQWWKWKSQDAAALPLATRWALEMLESLPLQTETQGVAF
ncbi:MAG: NUDIX domain-containing protein [Silvanigrellales bacterium]|nr:NUDIX domain-containing protein [Silvanigrellales bacterium]